MRNFNRPGDYALMAIPVSMIVLAQFLGKIGAVEATGPVNIFTFVAITLMLLRSLVWFEMLRRFELKSIYPLISSSYVFVLAIGYFYFGEVLSGLQTFGLGLILTGIYLHVRSEGQGNA
jgi:drug/metabolite transporter (DMT)-like permease